MVAGKPLVDPEDPRSPSERVWRIDSRQNIWSLTLPTSGPASLADARAVTVGNHTIEALISYHSAALGVFPGGVPWEEPSKRLAKALGKVTGYPYPPIDTGCEYTGTLADWAVENCVRAAVDMELSSKKVLPPGAVALIMHGMEFMNGNQVARDCAIGVLEADGD